jgi:hypothetical protein
MSDGPQKAKDQLGISKLVRNPLSLIGAALAAISIANILFLLGTHLMLLLA